MSGSSRSRKRAVRLTEDAAAMLQSALIEAWRQSGKRGKLTREAKAEILGLSVSTTERLLAGGGVDRATMTLAFASLKIAWREEFLRRDDAPIAHEAPVPAVKLESNVDDFSVGQHPRPLARSWHRPVVLGVSLAAASLLVWPLMLSRRAEATNQTSYLSTVKLLDGSHAFHAGDYKLAAAKVKESIQVASEGKDAGTLASALRVEGDLAAAKGDFDTALIRYGTALTLRQVLNDSVSLPALYEAMGDTRTRMRELDKAEADLTKSYNLYSRFHESVGVSMAARDLGTVWYLRGNVAMAEKWFQRAMSALKGQDKPELLTDLRARNALVLAQKGHIQQGLLELNNALKFWEDKRHVRWQAETMQQLGDVALLDGDQQSARDWYKKSHLYFSQVGDRAGAQGCAAKLADLQSGQPD